MPRTVPRLLPLACLVLPALSALAAPLRVVMDPTQPMRETACSRCWPRSRALVLLLGAWLASVRRAVRIRTRALEREQAQLRTLVESSPDLVWLKDGDGVYRACNAQTADVFGHRARGHPRQARRRAVRSEDGAARFIRDDAAALRSRRPGHLRGKRAARRLRSQHVFETIKTPVSQPDGTVLGVLGVARDISERREQEHTIREQERLLTEMSSLAQIGAWEIDLATDAFQWTEELAQDLRDPARPAGHAGHLHRLLRRRGAHPDRAIRSTPPRNRASRSRSNSPMVSGAGKRKWVRSICSAVLEGGRPVKLRGTVQDVTQRRDLEESMRMATLIYQTSLEAIVVTDEDNRIVDANPAFTRQTGCELRDVCGTRPALFDSSMHDSGFYERLWQALRENDHWQGEILDRNQDGSFTAKYVDIRVIRHRDGRVHRHVVQFHDISEQKRKDELIWRQTNFDVLTGLPNRRLFLDRLAQDAEKDARGQPAPGRAAARPRPLQGHQRQLRPCRRRQRTGRNDAAPGALRVRRRHHRPPGRQHVRAGGGRIGRPAPPRHDRRRRHRRDCRADRGRRRRPRLCLGQRRHQRLPGRWPGRRPNW